MTSYQYETREDSQGRRWVIELADGEGESEISRQLAMKEKIPVQTIIENERTKKQVDGIYEKLEKENSIDKVINLMFRTISWSSSGEFKPRTFASILEGKVGLATNPVDKQCVELAIQALNTTGGIPKKLKAAYGLKTNKSIED